jgi:hypothetical protein
MFIFVLELEIIRICRFGGVLIENVPFATFDLEKDGQGHTFSRSQYQKRIVGETLKVLSYHTHKSDVWFGL